MHLNLKQRAIIEIELKSKNNSIIKKPINELNWVQFINRLNIYETSPIFLS